MGGDFLCVNYEPVLVSSAQQLKELKTVWTMAFSIDCRAASKLIKCELCSSLYNIFLKKAGIRVTPHHGLLHNFILTSQSS